MSNLCSILLTICLTSISPPTQPPAQKWTSYEAWQRLTKQMSERNVIALLGEPKDKEFGRRSMIWYYQSACERINTEITSRPENGIIRFKRIGIDPMTQQPLFTVFNWTEPDWQTVTLMLEQEKLAAAQKLAEQQAKIEAAKQTRMDAIEKRDQLWAEQREKGREKTIERTQNKTPTAKTQLPGKKRTEFFKSYYLIFGGAFLFLLAFLCALLTGKAWQN